MNFETYYKQAWSEHAMQAQKVADELALGVSLVETNQQLSQMAGLITHVMGEHLGLWSGGVSLLKSLKKHQAFVGGNETENTLLRSIAALELGNNQNTDLNAFGPSDQVRIFAVAASALAERDTRRAQEVFIKALSIAETSIDKKDPANRSLAITGNNLACALEEKKPRSAQENELMILAAQTGRKYWEVTGTWLEVERAEYRLANTYLQANDLAEALRHAQACLKICSENKAGALEFFFGYEALALVEKERANLHGFQKAVEQIHLYFGELGDDDKKWCESTLHKFK